MIFVTVGNATQSFVRLLDAVDALAEEGVFEPYHVFVQSGHSDDFVPRYVEARPFIPMQEFDQRMRDARLIICQAGTTVLSVIRLGKMPVVMPRRKKYGEIVNDHQVQFARALAAQGRVIPAYEVGELREAVREGLEERRRPTPLPPSRMQEFVARAIEELAGAVTPRTRGT